MPDREPESDPVFYVHPDNWKAFKVFEACRTQWRVSVGMGSAVYQGLDYAAVVAVIDAMGVKKPSRVFNQVRAIEYGALSVINEQ